MIPVPDVAIGTPFGARSRLWSCSRNAAGEGIHTGVDFPADVGTTIVAARPGTAVYADHGAAFGNHQLEIHCNDGTRDFYAHMTTRLIPDGSQVDAGQPIGQVGEEGNVTGPHLHFERHGVDTGPWSCDIIRDPQPSLDYQEDDMADQATQDKLDAILTAANGAQKAADDARDQIAALRAAEANRAQATRRRDADIAAALDKLGGAVASRAAKAQVQQIKQLLTPPEEDTTP